MDKLKSSVGRKPVKLFEPKSNLLSSIRLPNSGKRLPDNWLLFKFSSSKRVKLPISAGYEFVRLFSFRLIDATCTPFVSNPIQSSKGSALNQFVLSFHVSPSVVL